MYSRYWNDYYNYRYINTLDDFNILGTVIAKYQSKTGGLYDDETNVEINNENSLDYSRIF